MKSWLKYKHNSTLHSTNVVLKFLSCAFSRAAPVPYAVLACRGESHTAPDAPIADVRLLLQLVFNRSDGSCMRETIAIGVK
jgi:hypothetical protein